ncbi:MAG: glycosyltransferase family 2 protein [Pirellulales bacterium]
MNEIAQITFWSLMALIAGQAVLVAGFVRKMLRPADPPLADDQCPRAAVVLCLRGADPFLPQCVHAILNQDYPSYQVHVVVDHPADPAWQVVTDAVAQQPSSHVSITCLARPLATCSLKCSSLVQAAAELDPAVEFLAQLDADVIPHRTWLRELAGALADESVGAATGNRWYMPDQISVAALVRCIWNMAAVVQMYWYGIAWGGTLAVKTRLFRETDLLERWSHAFCEDTMLFSQLRRSGLKVQFVPSLLMVNRESCDLGGYFRWVRRQLLTARLYHPRWLAVAGHAFVTSLVPALAVALLGVMWLQQTSEAMSATLWGLLIYQGSTIPLLVVLELTARQVIARRGEPTRWLSLSGWLAIFATIPITQVVYAFAMISALGLRRVDWRGVEYQIDGPWGLRLLEYRPYVTPTDSPNQSQASL